jgi:uncharacterized phage-associated protein
VADVFDVAAYILRERGPMTALKLQKLVYYSQAWSLVWDERPLFDEQIEAWTYGPVVPALYDLHRGRLEVSKLPRGDASALDFDEAETVDAVLAYYGSKPTWWLSDLTHMEDPWRDARKGCAEGERCSEPITHAALFEYYSSLSPDWQA